MKKFVCLFFCFLLFMLPASSKDYSDNEVIEENNIEAKIDKTTQLINESITNNKNAETISVLYWLRGSLYKQNNSYTEALKDYNTALKYTPEQPKLLKSICDIKIELKDYEGAISDANKIVSLEPKISQNYMKRAQIYFKSGQYQNAIKDYTQAIILQPKNPEAFELRGMLEIANKQFDKGFQDLSFAKQQYYELGMFDKYKEVVENINQLTEIKNKKNTKPVYSNTNYVPSSNYLTPDYTRQLDSLNNSLQQINSSVEWLNLK